jgi:hypothetical protein
MPAVPNCMVLNDELRSHRCSVAQRERCRPVQLFVCERSHCRFPLPISNCDDSKLVHILCGSERHFLGLELLANSFQIVLGLLLRVLCGLLGIGIRLQLVDGFVQALSFLSVSSLAA